MNADKLINWGELSRILSKNRSSITRKRIPLKHKDKINELLLILERWLKENKKASG